MMSKLEEQLNEFAEKFKRDLRNELEKAVEDAYNEGFLKGVENHKKPSQAQFRRDHSEPRDYGEDWACVVWAPSLKKAQELLECDPEYVEEMNIGWGTYNLDGEMTVGYVLNRSNNGEYQAYGYWL